MSWETWDEATSSWRVGDAAESYYSPPERRGRRGDGDGVGVGVGDGYYSTTEIRRGDGEVVDDGDGEGDGEADAYSSASEASSEARLARHRIGSLVKCTK